MKAKWRKFRSKRKEKKKAGVEVKNKKEIADVKVQAGQANNAATTSLPQRQSAAPPSNLAPPAGSQPGQRFPPEPPWLSKGQAPAEKGKKGKSKGYKGKKGKTSNQKGAKDQ